MFFKRILTAVVSFVLLFCFFYLGSSMLIGMEIGVETTIDAEHAHDNKIDIEKVKAEAKQKARAKVESNIGTIAVTAALLAALCSIPLSFCGVLPWCRRQKVIAARKVES